MLRQEGYHSGLALHETRAPRRKGNIGVRIEAAVPPRGLNFDRIETRLVGWRAAEVDLRDSSPRSCIEPVAGGILDLSRRRALRRFETDMGPTRFRMTIRYVGSPAPKT